MLNLLQAANDTAAQTAEFDTTGWPWWAFPLLVIAALVAGFFGYKVVVKKKPPAPPAALLLLPVLLLLGGCSMTTLDREQTANNLSDWHHNFDRAFGYVDSKSGLYIKGFLADQHELTREAHAAFLKGATDRAQAMADAAEKAGK